MTCLDHLTLLMLFYVCAALEWGGQSTLWWEAWIYMSDPCKILFKLLIILVKAATSLRRANLIIFFFFWLLLNVVFLLVNGTLPRDQLLIFWYHVGSCKYLIFLTKTQKSNSLCMSMHSCQLFWVIQGLIDR